MNQMSLRTKEEQARLMFSCLTQPQHNAAYKAHFKSLPQSLALPIIHLIFDIPTDQIKFFNKDLFDYIAQHAHDVQNAHTRAVQAALAKKTLT